MPFFAAVGRDLRHLLSSKARVVIVLLLCSAMPPRIGQAQGIPLVNIQMLIQIFMCGVVLLSVCTVLL